MVRLDVILREPAFPDFEDKEIINITGTIRVAGLEQGTREGKPSVGIGFELPDGRVVLAETTLALFLTAADALKAAYGDPREER